MTDSERSPAAKVMDEAIDLAIEGRSPYPERSAFDALIQRPGAAGLISVAYAAPSPSLRPCVLLRSRTRRCRVRGREVRLFR